MGSNPARDAPAMARKKQQLENEAIDKKLSEKKTTKIFAGQLKVGQDILCEDNIFREIVKIDPVFDPAKPNLNGNEVIVYLNNSPDGTILEFKQGGVTVELKDN